MAGSLKDRGRSMVEEERPSLLGTSSAYDTEILRGMNGY